MAQRLLQALTRVCSVKCTHPTVQGRSGYAAMAPDSIAPACVERERRRDEEEMEAQLKT